MTETQCKDKLFVLPNLEIRMEESSHDAIQYFNKLCPYCSGDLFSGTIRSKIEIDHYIPIAKGGQNVPWNILPVCKKCNRKKHDKMPEEFLPYEKRVICEEYLANVRNKMVGEVQLKIEKFDKLSSYCNQLIENYNNYGEIENLHDILCSMSEVLELSIAEQQSLEKTHCEDCLQCILNLQINGANPKTSISDLLQILLYDPYRSDTKKILEKYGIKIIKDRLIISNTAHTLQKAMATTAWPNTWAKELIKMPGAEPKASIRCNYKTYRAISLPITILEKYMSLKKQ